MRKGSEPPRHKILGIRTSAEEIVAFKQEALRRGISAADLFDELWNRYKAEREQARWEQARWEQDGR